MSGGVVDDEWFKDAMECAGRKRREMVNGMMMRRPYYGTKLDKELKNAKDRARSNRYRDD